MKKNLLFILAIFSFVSLTAESKYKFSSEKRAVPFGERKTDRLYITIERNGKKWGLEIPSYEEIRGLEDPQFEETKDGFLINFFWGGGRYFWRENFFFTEITDELYLYKIDTTIKEYHYSEDTDDVDEIVENRTRLLQPPQSISELNAEKISKLLGSSE